jgi:membrane associated rhomboid family serine protease
VKQPSEPIFNVPGVLVALIAVLVLVHVTRTYLLTPEQDVEILLRFAFIPARYDASARLAEAFPGGIGADLWSFVTYALIHADVTHISMNVIWMLPFGTAVARRFGPVRFLLFFAITATAGAAAHLLTHLHAVFPMVGASASISGFMAAAIRFAFQPGGPLETWRRPALEAYRVPAVPLFVALREPRILMFLAIWFGLNMLFGLGAVAMPGVEQDVAWQAHVGGFLAGLILFPIFDLSLPFVPPRLPENSETET